MNLAQKILSLCQRRGLRLALAESCTGGAIAAQLTSIAGASSCFAGSIVCYQEHVKSDVLHVSKELLERRGAVSEEVAREMLAGCLSLMSADVGMAITGLAGPAGGSTEVPVGTIWIATGFAHAAPRLLKLQLQGNRHEIIEQAVDSALLAAVELLE